MTELVIIEYVDVEGNGRGVTWEACIPSCVLKD